MKIFILAILISGSHFLMDQIDGFDCAIRDYPLQAMGYNIFIADPVDGYNLTVDLTANDYQATGGSFEIQSGLFFVRSEYHADGNEMTPGLAMMAFSINQESLMENLRFIYTELMSISKKLFSHGPSFRDLT